MTTVSEDDVIMIEWSNGKPSEDEDPEVVSEAQAPGDPNHPHHRDYCPGCTACNIQDDTDDFYGR